MRGQFNTPKRGNLMSCYDVTVETIAIANYQTNTKMEDV